MPNLPCQGGGVNPTSMAQNDTHVALIILTTQMWGGGGGIIGGKNFFGPKFVFLRLRRQHPFLHKTKGPTRNPISPTPPPLLRRASMSPPPPQSNFQAAQPLGRTAQRTGFYRTPPQNTGGPLCRPTDPPPPPRLPPRPDRSVRESGTLV